MKKFMSTSEEHGAPPRGKRMSPLLILGNLGKVRYSSELVSAFLLIVISSVGMFMMNVVLAKGMDVSSFGQVSYAISLTGILTLVATIGLPNASMKFIAEYFQQDLHCKIRQMIRFSTKRIAFFSISLSLLLFWLVQVLLYDHSMAPGMRIAALLLPLTALGLWRSKASRGMSQLKDSLIPESIIRPFLIIFIIGGATLIGIQLSLTWVSIVFLISYASALGYGFKLLLGSVKKSKRVEIQNEESKKWRKSYNSMLVVDVTQEVFLRCDVMVAGVLLSAHSLGIYTAASKIALLNLFFLKIVDAVYAPKMSAYVATGDRVMCWKLLKTSAVVAAVGSFPLYLLMMLVPESLLAFFGQEFVKGKFLLMVLATGQFVNAMTGSVGHALLMSGNEQLFSKICVVYAFLAVAGCSLAASSYGILGVAISFSLATCLFNILLFAVARRLLNSPVAVV